jgi:hypothetical protein
MSSENNVEQPIDSMVEESPNKDNCLVSQYENTPFLLVETDEGVFLAIGNNRLSEIMKDKETLDQWVFSNEWNLIGSFVMSLINNFDKLKIKEK